VCIIAPPPPLALVLLSPTLQTTKGASEWSDPLICMASSRPRVGSWHWFPPRSPKVRCSSRVPHQVRQVSVVLLPGRTRARDKRVF
jgi:hypothetical protein